MKPSGGVPPRMLHDLGRQLGRRDEILAVHLVVDVEREPAAGPVGLPLQLDVAAGHRRLDQRAVLVAIDDGAGVGVGLDHRHLQHAAGLGRDRQEDRVGRAPLLAQGRQHDGLHLVVVLQHGQQHLVEAARLVPIGRRLELVLEAEGIEEGAQPRVVGRAEARMLVAERIGHRRSAACRDGPPASPCWARCRAPCAARPCRRRSRTAAPARRSGAGRPGAPWWCARPRRRCRYAAGPTGRSRSRTARIPWPALCRRCGRPACGLLRMATRARPRRGNDRSGTWIGQTRCGGHLRQCSQRPKVPRPQ